MGGERLNGKAVPTSDPFAILVVLVSNETPTCST